MTVLFGHPTGNPNSHHAALAHFEAHQLEALCVPWMPSLLTLQILECLGPQRSMAARLGRRHFLPLVGAPKIQDRLGELRRLVIRALGRGDEDLACEANEWLMATMVRECRRPSVTAVHAYEDCALWQFGEAKRLGRACIYDMPVPYYPAWEYAETDLARKFADWLPSSGPPSSRYVRLRQKCQEMDLADLVLVPSSFVAETVRAFHPKKVLALAPYGVDLEFWTPGPQNNGSEMLRFIYAGQITLRKGIPTLLQAWEKAALQSAELQLVGSWHLGVNKRISLPARVTYISALSSEELRDRYRGADVFVFPSFFEGFGLVLLEAMACGLPVITSTATGGADVLTEASGRVLPVGDQDALVDALLWFDENRDRLREMGRAARKRAEQYTWNRYRQAVKEATSPFV